MVLGWCDFYILSHVMYKDQEKYIEVKEQMYQYVVWNTDICRTYISQGFDTIYDDSLKKDGIGVLSRNYVDAPPRLFFCRRKHWLDAAQDLQVAANTFNIPIASYLSSGHPSQLYLPFDIPKGQPLPGMIHFVNGNHFETIKTKRVP